MNYYAFAKSAFIRTPGSRLASPVRLNWLLLLLLLTFLNNLSAQDKRLVAIGSSTTVGYGSSSPDSSWFGRCTKYYKCRTQVIDSSFNLGISGADCYLGMPTGYVPPADRPSPDNTKNVSKAVTILRSLAKPDNGVIIVNYPSNGYNKFSTAEVMNCLQLIYDSATRSGNRCFITTTQPRADSIFRSSVVKKKLADIKDSIINRFGTAHTINFWDGMFDPADSTIAPLYSAGDQIHFNDAGHKVLFERVLAKNVFGLPVWYAAANGAVNILTNWGDHPDGSGNHPANFTADDQVFVIANNSSPTINGDWSISGKNVQLIIGDGINPVKLNIPPAYKINISSPQSVGTCQ